MRRVVVLIMTLITLTMFGCSEKTIILEEDSKVKQTLDNEKITERVIENKHGKYMFNPLFYNEEGIYGTLSDTRLNIDLKPELMYQPYLIDGNGEFNKLENDYFSYYDKRVIENSKKYYGIYSEGTHTKDRVFYYRDIIKDIKIKLDGYEKFIYEARENGGYSQNGIKVNNQYYVDILYTGAEFDGVGYSVKNKEKITVIDTENKVSYSVENSSLKNVYFYYDEKENCIMSINTEGEVSKLILKDGIINFEYYKKIDIKELFLNINYNYSLTSGENILLAGVAKEGDLKYAIYNIYSNEAIVIDDFIKAKVENSDLFISEYNGDFYLSKIGEDNSIEQIYKVTEGTEIDDIIAIANDDETSIFIVKFNYDTTENAVSYIDNIEYSFIEIKN